jgi:hypothetical protein
LFSFAEQAMSCIDDWDAQAVANLLNALAQCDYRPARPFYEAIARWMANRIHEMDSMINIGQTLCEYTVGFPERGVVF